MSRDAWTVAGAKAKFRELIERAKSEGPQKITKHGRTAVAIVATEEWERKTRRKANLAEFLASSALPRSRLRLKRLSLPACGRLNYEFSPGHECSFSSTRPRVQVAG